MVLPISDSPFGVVEFVPLKEDNADVPSKVLRTTGTQVWTPPAELSSEFVEPIRIGLEECVTSEGTRIYFPMDKIPKCISHAQDAGFALFSRDNRLSWENQTTYQAMRLIFDHVRRTNNYLRRKFACVDDLIIRRHGRVSYGENSVLPEDLGLDALGRGQRWSVADLLRHGRQQAREAGIDEPNEETAIRYGLFAAAERNPLFVDKQEEVESLVRLALFAPTDCTESLADRQVAQVYERLTYLLDRHRFDSREDLNRWLRGGHSNLPKAIANRNMDKDIVGKALQQLGWQAHRYVADCVARFFRTFQSALAQPLNPCEREIMGHMYMPQPYLGGLSLLLMYNRAGCFSPIFDRLWSSPGDPTAVKILHRLFWYYVEMSDKRRDADRRSKRKHGHNEIANTDFTAWKAVD